MIDWNSIFSSIKDWQTLIAGVLAFSGAWATLAGVNRQIQHNLRAEQERRRNEAYAARAVMPSALSEFCGYAEASIQVLDRISLAAGVSQIQNELEKLPTRPDAYLDVFKNAIRFSDPARQQELADLLAWYQVYEARLVLLRNTNRTGHIFTGVPQLIIDAADLYARASNLFVWARRQEESDLKRQSYENITSALRVCLSNYENNEGLVRLLRTRQPDQEHRGE